MKSEFRKTCIIAAVALAAIGGAAALYFFAAANPDWVAVSFLPWSRAAIRFLSLLNSWLPFSLAEVLVYAAIIGAIVYIILTIVRVCTRRRRPAALLRMTAVLLCVTACAGLFYEGVWAAGYHSRPLAQSLGIEVRAYSRDELYSTAEWLLETVNSEAENVTRGADGSVEGTDFDALADMACDSWNALASKTEFFASYKPVTAKPVLASEAMSYANITGIFFAFTGEANLNRGVPASSLPFTMAHELAHAAMVCPENEANFAAWLACRESQHAVFRYSGALAAFIYAYNSLYGIDRDAAFELYGRLSDSVRADLSARSEYWARYEGKVEKAATAVNNAYLKVMAQPDGVRSYGMVTDLLIAQHLRETA